MDPSPMSAWVKSRHVQRTGRCPLYPRKRTCAVQLGMSAFSQFSWPWGPRRELRHASFDDVGLVSSRRASERVETGRRTQMAKLEGVWIFDWDKYSPDDLVQKDDSFQFGPALLPALVKTGRDTTCDARARLRRPRSGSSRPGRAVRAARMPMQLAAGKDCA